MKTEICMAILVLTMFGAPSTAHTEVTARRGMVVTTSGAGTASAGVATLEKGGNAMDAALTAALLQPCLAAGSYVSYAGIINIVYFEAASGKVFNLNAGFNTVQSETEPLTIPGIDLEALASGNLLSFNSPPSGRTALVPGYFAGVEAARERFGKRRLQDLLKPAIECAEQGFILTPEIAGIMQSRQAVLQRLPTTRALFTRPDGQMYQAGERFRQPQLARTLRAVSRQGVGYIYNGAWASEFVGAVRREGGKMTLADLAAYQPTWIDPVHGEFNGFDVYAHGLPSRGGVTLLEGLNLAASSNLAALPPYRDSPLALFRMLQFAKLGAILNAPGVAPQLEKALGFDLSPAARTRAETSERLWKLLDAGAIPAIQAPRKLTTAHSDAVVAADRFGNVAALVHTINTVNWGSTGIFVGGISIPDSAAFQQALIATVTPGSRLPEDTSPGLVLRGGKPVLGFSGIGSGLNVRSLGALLDTLAHGMTPHQAIASPALGGLDFSRAADGEIGANVGAGELSDKYLQELRDLGQSVREDDLQRGYWIAIGIDASSGLRGGALREMQIGGSAQGY
jgi:gamma-glutamyltranspeptidase/glutathione hydrolase